MRKPLLALALIMDSALAQTLRIDSVSPAQGPIAGGTIVTISGANFTGAAVRLDENQTRTSVARLLRDC